MDNKHKEQVSGGKSTRWIPIGLGLMFLTLALVACGANQNAAKEASITVAEIVNRVEVNDVGAVANQPEFVEVKLGQSLRTGNSVKTHADSEARIDISVDDFTRISRTVPKTIWRMGSFAVDGGFIVELEEGQILVFDEDNGEENWPLHVVTPAGTASARGTWMGVGFDSETGVAEVQCFRGICELENEYGYQVLTDERTTSATAGSPPARSTAMTEDQVQRFWEIPEAKSEEISVPTRISAIEARTREMEAERAHFLRTNPNQPQRAALSDSSARTDGADRLNNLTTTAGNEQRNNESLAAATHDRASIGTGQSGANLANASITGQGSASKVGDDAALALITDSNDSADSLAVDAQAKAGSTAADGLASGSDLIGATSASVGQTPGGPSALAAPNSTSAIDQTSSGTGGTESGSGNAALVNGQNNLTPDPVDAQGTVVLSFDPEVQSQQIGIVLARLGWDKNEVANFILGTQATPHDELENQLARLINAAEESG